MSLDYGLGIMTATTYKTCFFFLSMLAETQLLFLPWTQYTLLGPSFYV